MVKIKRIRPITPEQTPEDLAKLDIVESKKKIFKGPLLFHFKPDVSCASIASYPVAKHFLDVM